MINAPIDNEAVDNIVMQLNNYTERYNASPTTKVSRQTILTSAKPFARYLSISAFKMSTTVLPQDIANERANSLISYYFDKKNMKDELKKFKTQQLTNIIMQNIRCNLLIFSNTIRQMN